MDMAAAETSHLFGLNGQRRGSQCAFRRGATTVAWRLCGAMFGVLSLSIAAGCSPPGLLIQPVTTRRQLVETEVGRDSNWTRDKIALIDVSGMLINAHTPQLLSRGEHPVSLLLEQLDIAAADPSVKGVILRINSPGGTVTASRLMYDEIVHFRKRTGKPVVAALMDVAASGGYFVACACDEIIAQPMTVTGSIGVVMQMIDLSGTMSKIGVRGDAITSGPFKDAGSPFRPLKPEEREVFQGIVDQMYEQFVRVVRESRTNLDAESVRSVSDGRVFIAEQALAAGLVDRIADMREVMDRTKEKAGISRARIVAYRRPLDYRPNFYARSPHGAEGERPAGIDINLFKIDGTAWWLPPSPQFLYLWSPGS
jgi:protease-4